MDMRERLAQLFKGGGLESHIKQHNPSTALARIRSWREQIDPDPSHEAAHPFLLAFLTDEIVPRLKAETMGVTQVFRQVKQANKGGLNFRSSSLILTGEIAEDHGVSNGIMLAAQLNLGFKRDASVWELERIAALENPGVFDMTNELEMFLFTGEDAKNTLRYAPYYNTRDTELVTIKQGKFPHTIVLSSGFSTAYIDVDAKKEGLSIVAGKARNKNNEQLTDGQQVVSVIVDELEETLRKLIDPQEYKRHYEEGERRFGNYFRSEHDRINTLQEQERKELP
ncbi:MAG: hypothetical protein HYT83_00250 [Candidatus Levybacteria bacterium]|nr:hypothetical protein [Candidatus Levybacteria bacterium]